MKLMEITCSFWTICFYKWTSNYFKKRFLNLEYVRYVEAHYKNGSLLLVFDENYKNEVFDYLNNYDLSDLQNREIPENCSQNLQVLDQSFKHELIKIFARRMLLSSFYQMLLVKELLFIKH